MKTNSETQRQKAMTLVEWLVVAFVIILLFVLLLPRYNASNSARAKRIYCLSNLKQIGLAMRMWANDHGDNFSWQVPVATNGTLEFTESPEVFRHFLALSNQLSSPKVLTCPSDTKKSRVSDWVEFSGANLSYFVRLDSDEGRPQTILSGDRNLTTNGKPAVGLVTVAPNTVLGFTREIHQARGNIVLGDGSAQQMSAASTTKQTFRLAIP
jgi:type II secretory pathway pseudopilin PulG